MRAVAYHRCSTQLQDTAAQQAICRSEIAKRGWELVEEFTDDAVSGSKTSRPRFDAMLQAVREGRVDAVVVASGDRLGRSAAHLLQIERELRRQGVALVLIRERCDLTTAMGRALFGMLSVFAELERECVSTRTRETMANRRKPRQPDAVAVTDEQIRALRRKEPGLSVRALAVRLGAAKSTVHRALGATS